MKNFPFSIFKIASITIICISLIAIIPPFDLFDMKQAQRIAKWKSTYEKLQYSFSLAKLHEGTIIPTELESGKINDEYYIISKLAPYFNLESNKYDIIPKYKYRKMNGRRLEKKSQFNFKKFVKRKDGIILGISKNQVKTNNDNLPAYFMFVDVNGNEKPNRIGKDIFFINIFKDSITALGEGKEHSQLKANCSPVGGGLYCSEYYLLGGNF